MGSAPVSPEGPSQVGTGPPGERPCPRRTQPGWWHTPRPQTASTPAPPDRLLASLADVVEVPLGHVAAASDPDVRELLRVLDALLQRMGAERPPVVGGVDERSEQFRRARAILIQA